MNPSIEARWFFESTADQVLILEGWFATFGEWQANESAQRPHAPPMAFKKVNKAKGNGELRTDYYLKTDGYSKLSFKIREGRTEVKVLDTDFGVVNFNGQCAGRIEKWIKWSPKLRMEGWGISDVFSEPGNFQAISKQRLMIKYIVDSDSNLVRVNPEVTDLSNGCQVELTLLEYDGRTLYTLAFESLGDEINLFDSFGKICDLTFHENPTLRLDAESSYSYPTLLSKQRTHTRAF